MYHNDAMIPLASAAPIPRPRRAPPAQASTLIDGRIPLLSIFLAELVEIGAAFSVPARTLCTHFCIWAQSRGGDLDYYHFLSRAAPPGAEHPTLAPPLEAVVSRAQGSEVEGAVTVVPLTK
jgi:hypothetical protein